MSKETTNINATVLEFVKEPTMKSKSGESRISEELIKDVRAFAADYAQKLKEEIDARSKDLSFEEKLKNQRETQAAIEAFKKYPLL